MADESKENYNNIDNCYKQKDYMITDKKKSFFILLYSMSVVFIYYFFILKINQNQCEIGDKEKCRTCNKDKCASCNLGYKLSSGRCLIQYDLENVYFSKENEEVKLFNDNFLEEIDHLVIDGERIEPRTKYKFNKEGDHTVYLKLKSKKQKTKCIKSNKNNYF